MLPAALKTSPELLAAVAAEKEMPLGLLCPQKSLIPTVCLLCAVLRCAVMGALCYAELYLPHLKQCFSQAVFLKL